MTDNERPDLVLAVNTPLTTSTSESGNFENFPIMLQSTKDFLAQIEKAVTAGIPVSLVDMAFSNGSDNTLVYGLYQDNMMYRLAAYNGWNTASNSVGYGISQGVLSRYMTDDAHRDMLTTQYLDNWAYQANIRDYIYRMQQKVEAGTVKRYYPTVMGEMQSRTKEQVQRYAATYLGVDPKTIQVTLPWNRLFEVYIDVHPKADVPVEAEVRHHIQSRELKQLEDKLQEAKKAVEEEKKKNAEAVKDKDNKEPVNTENQQKLEQAEAAAQAAYQEALAAQDLNEKEEMAQRNRTWAPQQ